MESTSGYGLYLTSDGRKILGRPTGALGKSRLDGREEEIQLLLNKGVSLACIAKIMEISRTALGHFIKTRKLD